jgi:hypothetical protein
MSRRHLYIAYMGGAHILRIEPAVNYFTGTVSSTPSAQMMEDFTNFSLTRHPNVGAPVVSMGLMLELL